MTDIITKASLNSFLLVRPETFGVAVDFLLPPIPHLTHPHIHPCLQAVPHRHPLLTSAPLSLRCGPCPALTWAAQQSLPPGLQVASLANTPPPAAALFRTWQPARTWEVITRSPGRSLLASSRYTLYLRVKLPRTLV